ncbi:uncharacterized protein BX663DRAFT_512935 [Cokeromyces recurvatus]|uniref:uncharacterized protein n=1 Tax=Cokeromyces recurvatus TaxID=90255 RepID=UPI00221F721A|nr:uncharacterized protein BX663DRAFT_512935 [Cokeromyces recurvatus]KAI7901931.1 hypothetical protein BX663DRAFT_512935 [Cokeromyces recurvatus]
MNLVNGNKSNTLYIETGPDDYYYSLQRYSTLYRILLARPYFTEIKFNTWNRIDLKLVNELGLTLTGDEKKHCRMEIDCQLLAEKEGTVQLSKECSITCRPIQHDAWEFTNASDIAGFHHDTYGNFEYMITIQDEGLALSPQITPTKYYIQIHPVYHPQQTIKALPLIIGPFTITETTPSMTTFLTENIDKEWKEPKTSLNIFHGYCLQDNSFLIVKEDWNMGTPGKMWDSALVLSQLFCDKINADPNYLNGCRLLDLSAG